MFDFRGLYVLSGELGINKQKSFNTPRIKAFYLSLMDKSLYFENIIKQKKHYETVTNT